MTRTHFWKLCLIIAVVGWSLFELYPPFDTPLDRVFRERVYQKDATFDEILAQYDVLAAKNPDAQYANLRTAIGTNSIARYFPFVDLKKEADATRAILNALQREAAGKIKLGIDLKGGTSATLRMDISQLPPGSDVASALKEAVEVIRKRVDRRGVSEPVIQPQGQDQILVQLPGLTEEDKAEAIRELQKAAFLTFRWVHPQSRTLLDQGIIEPGYERMQRVNTDEQGRTQEEVYLVEIKPAGGLTGKNVTRVDLARDNNGRLYVPFELDGPGAEIFARLTREAIANYGPSQRQLAIVLDGELRSAPSIESEITGGRGQITGGARGFSEKEGFELSNVLQNPLKAPLTLLSSQAVEPSTGKDTIRSGVTAALVGTALVVAFMLVYYLRGGFIANLALILNNVILLGIMCAVGTTITLPGIAGVVLTIGMAVDANVLIFERIREELAAGKSMRGALSAGYDKAFSTIFDSHITTLISSVILIWLGTGPVKGFGVALTIGVACSLFTALVVTRLIFDWLLSINKLKSLTMLHLIKGTKIDFMRWALPAFILSWSLIVIGNGYGIFVRGQDVLGIDFAGGEEQTYSFRMPGVQGPHVSTETEREALRVEVRKLGEDLKMGDVAPQIQRAALTGAETLRVITPFGTGDTNGTASAFFQALKEKLPQYFDKDSQKEVNIVGPIVGQAITEAAIISALMALFGILVYVAFRYEFSFAIGAVVAIIHDILMTMGWFFLSGRELSAPIVAAILTIIGFSINDTVVIFDRIREDLKLGIRGTFREVMNQALNQTLSRTLITSGTVFLATAALYWFGTGTIHDFAFTFLVGIITGTYSSIYIASAIVLWWHKGQRPKIGSGATQTETRTQAVPATSRA